MAKLKSSSHGTSTRFLTRKILDNFKIVLPSLSTQDQIVRVLGDIDDKITNNTRINDRLLYAINHPLSRIPDSSIYAELFDVRFPMRKEATYEHGQKIVCEDRRYSRRSCCRRRGFKYSFCRRETR
ncbi:MAG: restriction endonuclease subunit S [Coriobacteriales bacterium]|nr:restriction endonuclease subunit S [Coriobacteriales bacterium]